MNFSEEWKSLWPISSVHSPPLLLSNSSAKPLGPLLFSPSPDPPTLLFSSPSLSPPFSPTPSLSLYKALQSLTRPSKDPFLLPSIASSITSDFASQSNDNPSSSTLHTNNVLQMLRCPNNDILLFFPSGDNWDRVGFVKLSVKDLTPEIVADPCGKEFTTVHGLGSRVLDISVISVPSLPGNSVAIGFLLARTLYSVHWFRVEVRGLGSNLEKPALEYLGTKQFCFSVASACWNPHLFEESLVLLENGELHLFDLGSCSRADKFPVRLKGTRVPVSWEDFGLDWEAARLGGWLKCEFSWHPLVYVVACSNAVFMVDWRFQESKVTISAEISMVESNLSVANDQFVAFCKAGSDGFYFSIATEYHLFLLDIRKPLMPVLQWAHGIDKPHYINVFRLSELRYLEEESNYRWASESGFTILLGSFYNCEFNLYCYGPPLPTPHGSVASKVLKLCNSLYAWEIPSELSMLDRQCYCGDCILEKDFSKTTLPQLVNWWQKEEMVLGFCIIGEDLLDTQLESGGLGGFTLIKLVSSGKLKLQKYHASWDYISSNLEESREKASSCVVGSHLYSLGDQKYKYCRRFKYVNLDYLIGYLNGDLSNVMISNMQNFGVGSSKTIPYTGDKHEVIHDMLKVAGVDPLGSPPFIADVLNNISLPMSIYEIASSRIWAGIPSDLLQLAFSTYLELMEILVDEKKMSMQFLNVPSLPQFPPFFLRKPSIQSNRFSHNAHLDDALVGPVLPLPILRTLSEVGKEEKDNCVVLEDEMNGFSADNELRHECKKVRRAANDMVSSGSCAELNDSCTVSLAHDGEEKWVPSQEPHKLFLYKPLAFLDDKSTSLGSVEENPVFEDESFGTFISKMHDENFSSNPKDLVGLEVFDELCPVKLKFESPPMNISSTEMKGYNLLKRQFSKWQENFKPYGDFCKASKIHKRAQ